MKTDAATIEKACAQRSTIAAYLDGELSPREELAFDCHAAVCQSCTNELNEQKRLFQALDCAFEAESEIELPKNFARVVAANAESKVSGLRRPQERSKALFACAALFLLVILGLGREARTVVETFGKFAEQIFIVAGFAWNLVYDVAFGTAVILRSLGQHLLVDSNVWLALPAVLLFISLATVSRFVLRLNRA